MALNVTQVLGLVFGFFGGIDFNCYIALSISLVIFESLSLKLTDISGSRILGGVVPISILIMLVIFNSFVFFGYSLTFCVLRVDFLGFKGGKRFVFAFALMAFSTTSFYKFKSCP